VCCQPLLRSEAVVIDWDLPLLAALHSLCKIHIRGFLQTLLPHRRAIYTSAAVVIDLQTLLPRFCLGEKIGSGPVGLTVDRDLPGAAEHLSGGRYTPLFNRATASPQPTVSQVSHP
jgi:hypothetical protein